MSEQMEGANKAIHDRNQLKVKLYETSRMSDDPESTKAKETAKLDAKREGELATHRQQADIALKGILPNLQSLVDFANSGDLSDSAIGPWNADDGSKKGSWNPLPSGQTMSWLGSFANPSDYGHKLSFEGMRAKIMQDTMGILNVTKVLVRKPGEGPFSEGDQALLNKLLGDLTKAQTTDELKHLVKSARDVIDRTLAKPLGLSLGDLKTEKGAVGDKGGGAKPPPAAGEPVGATRMINGQPYTKTPQGWIPGGAAPASPPPAEQAAPAPMSPNDTGGQPAQQAAMIEQMRRLGIDPSAAMGGR